MKYRQIITFMLLGLFLNGCSTYRNYERPVDIRTDGLYGGEMTDSASLGSLSWRDLFTDPALQVLIEEGLANNTDLRMAELQITEAEAALKAARLAFLPNLSLSPQGGLGGFVWNGTPRTYTLPAMATWQVDVFGSLRNAKKRTQMQLEQSRAYRQAVQAHLISSIANYYYTLAMLDAQLKVSEETAESWKQGVEMTKALMEVGEETDAAVSQSEANYYDVCTQIVEIKRQIREVENGFSSLLGRTPDSIRRGTLADWQFSDSLSVGVPVQLLSRRPDVRQAKQALAAAFYATGEARAAFYPTLTLSGLLGWSNHDGLVNPGNWIWQALASLTQPVFQNGRLRAQLAISKTRQEEAKLAFQQTLLDAGAEVNTALADIQSSHAKTELYGSRIAALKRAVKSTQLLMLNTSANYLLVLTAQQDLLAAQLADIGNRFDSIRSVIELYLALGGGS